MELQIIFHANKSKYLSIYESIKQDILSKKIMSKQALPPKRKLAEQLNVSVYTVQQAYEQLLTEGYAFSIEKKGIYVADLLTNDISGQEMTFTPLSEDRMPEINLRNGQVDARLFPFKMWQKLMKNHFNETHASTGSWQGEPALRNQIALYLQKARGIPCQPTQIFVGSGIQQQLQMLLQFLQPKKIGIENPGFHRAFHLFQQVETDLNLIAIDEEGCKIPSKKLDILYITPAHQFPLGKIMTIKRKMDLINWAIESDCYLVEDDYDAEFRYVGTPIPPLSQIAQKQSIYMGSFSKTLLPAFRISYMVLPLDLVKTFENIHALQKSTVSRFTQCTLAEFMKEGYYERHIAKMRTHYAQKRNYLIQWIKQHFSTEVKLKGEEAGLHLLVEFPNAINEVKIIDKAKQHGLLLDSINQFDQNQSLKNVLLIGYGAPTIEEMEKALCKLKEIIYGKLKDS